MNPAPGKSVLIAMCALAALCLACLMPSAQATTLTPEASAQIYHPGPPDPWLSQPPQPTRISPLTEKTQPPLIPTVPVPPPVPPGWNNNRHRQYNVQYDYRRTWPPVPGARVYPQPLTPQPQPVAPYLETRIENTSAYVYQNLVVAIDVISSVNIKSATLQLQDNDDFIMRQLGEVTVDKRKRPGRNEIVNTIFYLLTPLRSGDIELPPLQVTGTMDGGADYPISYDATASNPIRIMVSAPDPSVRPWLPLGNLELSARLSNDENIGEGEPLTLTVEQRAVGMSGSQLPSVENQLQAPGHRLYREKTEHTGVITAEGKLVGTRSDRFTLVPQQGDRVEIPAIHVDWWNVERRRKETAVLQGRLLNEVPNRGNRKEGSMFQPGSAPGSLLMWLFLLFVAFTLGRLSPYYLPGIRRYTSVVWQHLYVASEPLRRHYGVWKVRLSPQRNMHLLRRKIGNSLPQSARLWYCVRNADQEQDVDDWSQVLRFLVQRRLQLPAQLPMSKLAEHIIAIHPGSDPAIIRNLLNQLEAALFGGKPIDNFDAWKKAFKRQVKPRFFGGWRRSQRVERDNRLAALNPVAR